MVKSFGIFAIVFISIFALVGIYFLMRCCARSRNRLLQLIKLKLERKLFYGSFHRYMIISNLKLTYTIWAFLCLTASLTSIKNKAISTVYMLLFGAVLVWPLYVIGFMMKYKDILDTT